MRRSGCLPERAFGGVRARQGFHPASEADLIRVGQAERWQSEPVRAPGQGTPLGNMLGGHPVALPLRAGQHLRGGIRFGLPFQDPLPRLLDVLSCGDHRLGQPGHVGDRPRAPVGRLRHCPARSLSVPFHPRAVRKRQPGKRQFSIDTGSPGPGPQGCQRRGHTVPGGIGRGDRHGVLLLTLCGYRLLPRNVCLRPGLRPGCILGVALRVVQVLQPRVAGQTFPGRLLPGELG